jgi:taurine dioxygenase
MAEPSLARRSAQSAPFEVAPFNAALGAEIRGIDITKIDDATFDHIHAVWLDNVLLALRGQSVSAEDLVRLVKRFGKPVSSSGLHERDMKERAVSQVLKLPPEVTMVSNIKENGQSVGILGDGEIVWHSDFSFKEAPTAARMLIAQEIPPQELGGSTFFLNCYAAYDALSPEQKKRYSGKTIKQGNTVDTAMKLRPGASLDVDIRTAPGPSHPIISTHPETGANSLFLGRRHSAYVNGLSLEDSEAMLDELWAHCTQPCFVYEHKWAVGDVVIWDNRCTVHRRDAFNSDARRVLFAAQVEGHKPFEAPDALARPPHPRSNLNA